MRWIKASERLPSKAGKYEIRIGGKLSMQYNGNPEEFNKSYAIETIEWLDELGSEPEGKEAVELREALEKIAHDAYPGDIFPPITSEQWKEIHEMIKEKFGFPIDRLTAEYGRLLRKPIISIATEALNKI